MKDFLKKNVIPLSIVLGAVALLTIGFMTAATIFMANSETEPKSDYTTEFVELSNGDVVKCLFYKKDTPESTMSCDMANPR